MKFGARNRIVGKVEEIKRGSIMCMVKVSVAGPSEMASVMYARIAERAGYQRRAIRSK